MKQFIEILRFILRLLKRILIPSTSRFIRLSPNHIGKIRFYDRHFKKFFFVKSRNYIDSVTADQIYTFNDYDINFLLRADEIREKYKLMIRSGLTPLIIDCGANIGLSARYFSDEFPEALVIAIEPDGNNLKAAKDNCKNYSNIEFFKAAIGAESGKANIDNFDVDPNSYRVTRSDSENALDVLTIDSILNKYVNTQLFITKIDIEGFEDDLFSSNTDWIDDCLLLIIELHDWMMPKTANSNNFLKAISAKKRDFVYKEENIFSIHND
jgi:FkbM family methyltransferase